MHLSNFLFLILCIVLEVKWATSESGPWHKPTPSLLKIDPGRILPYMIKYGGLVLPKETEEDLLILDKLCSCDLTSLDVINKELEVLNFTVCLPGYDRKDTPALKVKRLFLRWNSYLHPCIEVEVEDVEVLVEFTNLLLTNSNWNELKKEGFPPQLEILTSSEIDTSSSTLVRIGRVDLEGAVTLKVISRSLGGQSVCPDVVFEFGMLEELVDRIKHASIEAERKTGRKGCTTTELYDIVEQFFKSKLKKMLQSTVMDIARGSLDPNSGGSKTVRETKNAFEGARGIFQRYTQDVASVTEDRIQSKLSNQLSKWGLSGDQVETLKKASKKAADTAVDSFSAAQSQIDRLKSDAKEEGTLVAERLTEKDMQKWGLSSEQMEWVKAGYKAAADAAVAGIDAVVQEGSVDDIENDGKESSEPAKKEELFYPPW